VLPPFPPLTSVRLSPLLDAGRIRRIAVSVAVLRLFLAPVPDIPRGRVVGQGVSGIGGWGSSLVAAPEAAAGSVGVVVARGGAEALLALVVAGQQHLEEDGDDEEEALWC